jgi:hypothetical protein
MFAINGEFKNYLISNPQWNIKNNKLNRNHSSHGQGS